MLGTRQKAHDSKVDRENSEITQRKLRTQEAGEAMEDLDCSKT